MLGPCEELIHSTTFVSCSSACDTLWYIWTFYMVSIRARTSNSLYFICESQTIQPLMKYTRKKYIWYCMMLWWLHLYYVHFWAKFELDICASNGTIRQMRNIDEYYPSIFMFTNLNLAVRGDGLLVYCKKCWGANKNR